MTKPLSQQDYFNVMQVFETIIIRKRQFSNDIEMLIDILNYDAYGLSNVLFLKNNDIDDETKAFCANKAKDCFEKDFELIKLFENEFKKS